jgi:hypothetical protein
MASREWDMEWAAQRAADALRYLGRNFPDGLENSRVLDKHEQAAHEGAWGGILCFPAPSEPLL